MYDTPAGSVVHVVPPPLPDPAFGCHFNSWDLPPPLPAAAFGCHFNSWNRFGLATMEALHLQEGFRSVESQLPLAASFSVCVLSLDVPELTHLNNLSQSKCFISIGKK